MSTSPSPFSEPEKGEVPAQSIPDPAKRREALLEFVVIAVVIWWIWQAFNPAPTRSTPTSTPTVFVPARYVPDYSSHANDYDDYRRDATEEAGRWEIEKMLQQTSDARKYELLRQEYYEEQAMKTKEAEYYRNLRPSR